MLCHRRKPGTARRAPRGPDGNDREGSVGEARKVAAILVADIVGYSRLTGADEEATLARLRALRSELFNPAIEAHRGRVVKRMGDGVIVEFRSVVEAVRCAIVVAKGLAERNADVPPDRRIEVRTGIHLGDVVEEPDGDLLGDGVNIAARLEGICEPGGVCLSEDAWRQVRDKLPETFVDLGERRLKNIARPMRAYALGAPRVETSTPAPAGTTAFAATGNGTRPAGALVGAAAGAVESLGRLIGAYADKAVTRPAPGAAGDGASMLDERRRRRTLRRIIIGAAILSAVAVRACTERHVFAPPPAPPRAGVSAQPSQAGLVGVHRRRAALRPSANTGVPP